MASVIQPYLVMVQTSPPAAGVTGLAFGVIIMYFWKVRPLKKKLNNDPMAGGI